jgi:trimeric autotransporter adhesin
MMYSLRPASSVHRYPARHSRVRAMVVAAALALMAGLLTQPAPVQAAEPLPDGLTLATAAGSCWEVKRNYPSSPDGTYWIVTPTLQTPGQFYCDMTTDGGGWVLVGRGREGWKAYYQGVRPNEVRTAVAGTAAFRVAQLSSKTIDGLLNGGRPDALTDGVRLRRAKDSAGTTYQEVRFKFTKRSRWAWVMPAENPVGAFKFDSTTGSGGLTSGFGPDTRYNRVDTTFPSTQNYVWGFAYGSQVVGSTAATSYLWSYVDGRGSARPFTQVWLRPQLTLSDMGLLDALPDSGTPKTEQRSLASADAAARVWGVTGLANGKTGELNTEVQAFAQLGTTVFVGGNFRYVQKSRTSTGVNQVDQPYLAAFNVDTGDLITTFRPAFNEQIKALYALPDGRLAVGGQFTTVNGEARPSLVFLDPVTGAVSGRQVTLENRNIGGLLEVRNFDVQDGWLYLSGAFTHLVGSAGQPTASAWNAARIGLATTAPDTDWNPTLNGTSVGVDASARGDRVYYSGYFRTSGSVPTLSATAIQTVAGAPVVTPVWAPTFSKSTVDASGNVTGNIWQLDVQEVGDRVYLLGSEHSNFGYQRSDFALVSGSITKNGGDFQTATADADTLYAACHCADWVYQDTYTWSNVGTGWTQVDKIGFIAAWDAATGQVLQEFSPVIIARAGYGPWASFIDSRGTLWVGGDLDMTDMANGVSQWSGGFARFPLRDSTAPTTPTGFASSAADPTVTRLSWNASTDAAGAPTYEILRNTKVVATTSGLSIDLPALPTAQRYFVRAADAAGNRSASTPVLQVAAAVQSTVLVANASQWRWAFSSSGAPAGWTSASYDDSSWNQGSAVLGFGASGLGTDISIGAPSPRPLSAQFRKSFTVDDPRTLSHASLTVLANDGVVVYVNGTEVGRANMPAGTITSSTYATAAPRAAAAAAAPVTFTFSSLLLKSGTNVVTAETHMNYRTTPDVTFDLKLVAEIGDPEVPPPPSAPVVTATGIAQDSISVSWTDAATSTAVTYRVLRGGSEVALVNAPVHTYVDSGLDPSTTYTYSVVGVDQYGQQSAPGTASATTFAPQPTAVTLVARGATWHWNFSATAPASLWYTSQFDDSAWALGTAKLGFGTTGLGTDISVGAPSPRPLSAQFRRSFTVPDPTKLSQVTVSVIADDGVIVYVNGTEVGRKNLPTGTITWGTYATAAPRSASAATSPVTFSVPASLLVAGTNIVSAETHLNYRSSPDASFDLDIGGLLAP